MELELTWVQQVMLVDLARNDVNRVCDPLTTRVDKLMVVQKVGAWQRGRAAAMRPTC